MYASSARVNGGRGCGAATRVWGSDMTARLALISRTAATVTTPARKMRPTADRTILARDGGRALGPLAPVAGESTGGDVRPLAIDTPYRGRPRSSRSSQSASIATGAAGGRSSPLPGPAAFPPLESVSEYRHRSRRWSGVKFNVATLDTAPPGCQRDRSAASGFSQEGKPVGGSRSATASPGCSERGGDRG